MHTQHIATMNTALLIHLAEASITLIHLFPVVFEKKSCVLNNMDNRAKAQAHIERAQMYLGLGQTEFGQTDFGKEELSNKDLIKQANAPIETLVSDSGALSRFAHYAQKKSAKLGKMADIRSKEQARQRQQKTGQELKNRLWQASITLAETLVHKMETKFEAALLEMQNQRNDTCKDKVRNYTHGFKYYAGEEESVTKKAMDMCQKYHPQNYSLLTTVILEVVESTQKDSQYTDWRELEVGYINFLKESSETKITIEESAYKRLHNDVKAIQDRMLNRQDPKTKKNDLVMFLAERLQSTSFN